MRLHVMELWPASERIESTVKVETTEGPVNVVVDRRSIVDGTVNVHYPVAIDADGNRLVELPREAVNGCWRVWVDKTQLSE